MRRVITYANHFVKSWNAFVATDAAEHSLDFFPLLGSAKNVLVAFWWFLDENAADGTKLRELTDEIVSSAEIIGHALRRRERISETDLSWKNISTVAGLVRALDGWIAEDGTDLSSDHRFDIYDEHFDEHDGTTARQDALNDHRIAISYNKRQSKFWIFKRARQLDETVAGFRHEAPLYTCLPNHRILPREINGYHINVVPLRRSTRAYRQLTARTGTLALHLGGYNTARRAKDMVCRTSTSRVTGKNVSHIFSPSGGINEKLRLAQIFEHFELARTTSVADLVLLPELTLTPELSDKLAARLGRVVSGPEAALLVPGTYHFELRKERRNRGEILTSDGVSHIFQDKLQPYTSAPARGAFMAKEAINGSKEINLLLMGDYLFGLAICRDFIDQVENDTWMHLDVSVLLVPAMGDKKTEEAHVRSLRHLSVKGRTTAAVSQESRPSKPAFWFGWYDSETTVTRGSPTHEVAGTRGTWYTRAELNPR